MMRPVLIINGTLVSGSESKLADIAIANGKIREIGILDAADYPDSEVLDAKGKLVFPGGIDPHVHLALLTPAGPSCDDFNSGSLAAIAGGTTSFIDFVTPGRAQAAAEAFTLRLHEAGTGLVDFGLHMGISGWHEKSEAELSAFVEKHKIISYKTYLAYRETIGIGYPALKMVMEIVRQSGGVVLVHCEDGEMISKLQQGFLTAGKLTPEFHALAHPPEAEVRAVDKVIELSAQTGCRVYIVHCSTGKATERIRQAKASGLKIYAETCPQYLFLDDSVYFSQPEKKKILPYIISPPIRTKEDQEILWQGLSDGTFDTVATDHCPFNLKGQKERGIDNFTRIPNGAGGIEHRLTLLYTYGVMSGRITPEQFVRLTAENPAEIFGFGDHKGKLMPGYDADIVIWDPERKNVISVRNHHQACDSEIFEGVRINGSPSKVLVNGEIAFDQGKTVLFSKKTKLLNIAP